MPTELSRGIIAYLDADAAGAASATGDRATGSGTSAANDGPPNLWHCTHDTHVDAVTRICLLKTRHHTGPISTQLSYQQPEWLH